MNDANFDVCIVVLYCLFLCLSSLFLIKSKRFQNIPSVNRLMKISQVNLFNANSLTMILQFSMYYTKPDDKRLLSRLIKKGDQPLRVLRDYIIHLQ